jgi:hypothetical protein
VGACSLADGENDGRNDNSVCPPVLLQSIILKSFKKRKKLNLPGLQLLADCTVAWRAAVGLMLAHGRAGWLRGASGLWRFQHGPRILFWYQTSVRTALYTRFQTFLHHL